jgi:hypothetical protein
MYIRTSIYLFNLISTPRDNPRTEHCKQLTLVAFFNFTFLPFPTRRRIPLRPACNTRGCPYLDLAVRTGDHKSSKQAADKNATDDLQVKPAIPRAFEDEKRSKPQSCEIISVLLFYDKHHHQQTQRRTISCQTETNCKGKFLTRTYRKSSSSSKMLFFLGASAGARTGLTGFGLFFAKLTFMSKSSQSSNDSGIPKLNLRG